MSAGRGRVKYLFVPDLHCPAADMGRVREVARFARAEKPERIIFLGDIFDNYPVSRHAKSIWTLMTPGFVKEMKAQAVEIFKLFEGIGRYGSKCLEGNHDRWLYNQYNLIPYGTTYIQEFTESPHLFHKFFRDRGVHYIPQGELLLPSPRGPIHAIHGDRPPGTSKFPGGAALNKAKDSGRSTVAGHSHALGCMSWGVRIQGMECGHLIDMKHAILTYDPRNRRQHGKSCPGFGIADTKGRLHPFSLA